MKRSIALALEDTAHEQVLGALLARIFSEESEPLENWDYRVLPHRGGSGSVTAATDYVNRCKRRGHACDLFVWASDANCKGFVEKRNEIKRRLQGYPGKYALALPNPHIEHWLILDPQAFQKGVGLSHAVQAPKFKCDKGYYKKTLNELLRSSGVIPQFPAGIEYAPEIIKHLDLHTARKDTSFDEFYTSVVACLKDA